MSEDSETEIINKTCHHCHKTYALTDDEFEIIFGYKSHDVPFNTCTKCRGKNRSKVKCDRCDMDVIEGEMTMHRTTEHCCRTHFNRQRAICEYCSHLEVSCMRCDAWLYNRPERVISLNEYIQNTEHGLRYIQNDLKTKLNNIEYRRKYKAIPDDEEINIDPSLQVYVANIDDGWVFNDGIDEYY